MKKQLLALAAAAVLAALPYGLKLDNLTVRNWQLVPAAKYACAFPIFSGGYPCGAVTTGGGGGTSYTLSGPASGAFFTASTNFTVSGNPSSSTTITPNDSSSHGVFNPTTDTLSSTQTSATFTYTPITTGSRNIATTNSSTLTNPAAIAYSVANADPGYPGLTAGWAGNNGLASFTTGVAGDPFGGSVAAKQTESTSTGLHSAVSPSLTVVANQQYRIAIMAARSSGTRNVQFEFDANTFTAGAGFTLNLGTCTATAYQWGGATDNGLATSTTNLAAGWCLAVMNVTLGNFTTAVQEIFLNNGTTNNYTGDGTSSVLLYGPVLE